ncbi:Na-translocating system protein MpsC family protein [Bacillus salitolerans]|uniref:Na-translocating system protein MpsC family protein n=1 Tax=Bacillus salitolerans TaxID=1437434 RepID=A0ABW4LK17_9BACI
MKKAQSQYQENLLHLSSTFSKILKQRFGKGPETCAVTYHSKRVTVYVRNFITPAEEVLVDSGQMNLAINFRNAVMDRVAKEFIREAMVSLDISLDSYYYDWDYENNTGVMLLQSSTDKYFNEASAIRGKIFNQIMFVSSEVHKVPKRLDLIRLNQNIVVVECKGIMLQVEKVLYQKGHLDILQERSREIKDRYLEYKNVFASIFERDVLSIYMAWDYAEDSCYIFFYLQ